MSQLNDMGDAPAGPGLSAPEGASIPIAQHRIALVFDHDGQGGFFARMTVYGLKTEDEAQLFISHMQKTYCGEQIHEN